jgi:TetR/AcrR family transcriptional regulator, cholesterol catabolism regulator
MAEMDEIKQKIIAGANELFMKYGIRSVTMDDIASDLGISKKTIYQTFSEKDEIVAAVVKMHCVMWEHKTDEIAKTTANAIEELLRFSVHFRDQMKRTNPNLMFDMHKYHRETWDEWSQYKAKVIKQKVINTINRGITEGYFRKDLNAELLGTFRVEQLEMAFDSSIFPHDKFNFEDVQMQLFDHFIYGCLTRKGLDLYEESKRQLFEHEPIPSIK